MIQISGEEEQDAERHEGNEAVQVIQRGCIIQEGFENRDGKKEDRESSSEKRFFNDSEYEKRKCIYGPDDREWSVFCWLEGCSLRITGEGFGQWIDFCIKPSGDLGTYEVET